MTPTEFREKLQLKYSELSLPTGPIRVSEFETIIDPEFYVESLFKRAEFYGDNVRLSASPLSLLYKFYKFLTNEHVRKE